MVGLGFLFIYLFVCRWFLFVFFLFCILCFVFAVCLFACLSFFMFKSLVSLREDFLFS